MSEWKAYLSRITLFPNMPPGLPMPSPPDLYKRIWGEPESYQKQLSPLMPAFVQGRHGRLQVNCLVQPIRIDINLTAAPSQEVQMTVAMIDDPIELREELKRIIGLVDNGLVTSSIWRVALSLQFLNLKPSIPEANKAVTRIIPNSYGVRITDDEEDFVFQINRPRNVEDIPGIKMNFVTKWSVEQFQVLTIAVPIVGVAPGIASPSPQPQMNTSISASVAFDNNNTPIRTLTGKEQSILLHKALDAAVEMQKKIGLNIEGF